MSTLMLYLICIIVILLVIFIGLLISNRGRTKEVPSEDRYNIYKYTAKQHLMTSREEACFRILERIFGKKYYVIPQVHLSALFDHESSGENKQWAFMHINGKSVDFVLMNKETLRPVCAIEIDDYTHNSTSRYKRDQEVERIFKEANFPLVRSRQFLELTDEQIFSRVKRTIERSIDNQ